MTDVYSDEYWLNEFDITQNDLGRIAGRMAIEKKPQDLKSIAMQVIHGRLTHGHDFSPSAIANLTGTSSVCLWDPEADWKVGDLVLIARENQHRNQYEAFLGRITTIYPESAVLYIDELHRNVEYTRLIPGTHTTLKYGHQADTWRNTVKEAVERKLQTQDVTERSEGILLRHGEAILNKLLLGLETDSRFIGLENKWYLMEMLSNFEENKLENLHARYVGSDHFTLDKASGFFENDNSINRIILQMSIQAALINQPDKFKNNGTSLYPMWKALLPPPEKSKAKFYVYDPQTYEILCSPEQRLSPGAAKRLLELEFYNHVAAFVEGG